MTFTRKKCIKGKSYYYAERSIRLPNGRIKRVSKLIKNKNEAKKHEEYFDSKEKEILKDFAVRNYRFNYPLTKENVSAIEEIKVDYKRIIRKLKKTNNMKDLLDRFIVNFTYESNALEGNSLTLKDVAIVIFENLSIPGKELREIYEARNSRPIVDLLMAKKIHISHESIIKIHKLLMKDIDEETGYKKLPNFVLGSTFKTTLPEKVYEEMDKLIEWYKKSEDKVHPLRLAAIFHGKFLQIHPFKDGNGRVGRFLLNAILVNKDYSPIIIRKSQRVSYLRCLKAFDQGNKTSVLRFMLERFKKTYKDFFEVYIGYL